MDRRISTVRRSWTTWTGCASTRRRPRRRNRGAGQGLGWTSTASAEQRAGPDTTPRPIRTTRGPARTTPPRPTSSPTRSKLAAGRPPVTGPAAPSAGPFRHVIPHPDTDCWFSSWPPSRCSRRGGGSVETPPTRSTHIPAPHLPLSNDSAPHAVRHWWLCGNNTLQTPHGHQNATSEEENSKQPAAILAPLRIPIRLPKTTAKLAARYPPTYLGL
jgi:hypothetical protein